MVCFKLVISRSSKQSSAFYHVRLGVLLSLLSCETEGTQESVSHLITRLYPYAFYQETRKLCQTTLKKSRSDNSQTIKVVSFSWTVFEFNQFFFDYILSVLSFW